MTWRKVCALMRTKMLEMQFILKIIDAAKETVSLIKLSPVITKIESVSVEKNKSTNNINLILI